MKQFSVGDYVILARVRHSAFRGYVGRVKRVIKSRSVIKVETTDGRLYDAAPENLDAAEIQCAPITQ